MSIKISGLPWYDRNPFPILKAWDGDGKAPHASTLRWEYSVPKDKFVFLEIGYCYVVRITASTNEGKAGCGIGLKVSPTMESWIIEAQIYDKAVGAKDSSFIGQSGILVYGNILRGFSWDASPDGTCDLYLHAKLTEFDMLPGIDQEVIMEPAKGDIQQPEKPWWWPW